MRDWAIRTDRLGKRYRLGLTRARARTMGEALAQGLKWWGRDARSGAAAARDLWALRDVSLEVARGEVLGVIGRNGAGKSTLLKILSRITAPTSGHAELRGRVGSLLEVGTGFHLELTGRENVFLNGAILGMRRSEIARKFDRIVEFAEVTAFLDTPVKRYSSGMYMRLAFAVAAHLDPEILLVDEVLAVGDVAFQRKCLGRMGEVAHEGRTVLFVSHNLDAIQRLCPRAVLLEAGGLAAVGASTAVVSSYLDSRTTGVAAAGEWIPLTSARHFGTGEVRFEAARFRPDTSVLDGAVAPGSGLELDVQVATAERRAIASLAVTIESLTGIRLIDTDIAAGGQELTLQPGTSIVTLHLPAVHLNPGVYNLGLWIGPAAGTQYDSVSSAFDLMVVPAPSATLGAAQPAGLVPALLRVVGSRAVESHAPVPDGGAAGTTNV